jgi:cell division protein FtsQ
VTATARRTRPAGTRRQSKARRSWRRRALALVVIVVVLALLAGSLWIVYFSSVLATRRVTVAGTRDLTPLQVSFSAQVPLGVPLARQDLAGIAARLTAVPVVEAATVTRSWPGTIRVTVVERRPVFAVLHPDGYVVVDKHGVAYQTRATLPPKVVLADISTQDKPLLSEVAIVASALPDKLDGKVRLITADSRDSIALVLSSGRIVTWGNSADSELKARVLTALLKKKPKRSIDVSSPHTPAVR